MVVAVAATVLEAKTRFASDLSPEIASLAVDSEESGGGWEKLLTAQNSWDQGSSLGFGNEEEEEDIEILEEKQDTTDLRHIVIRISLRVEGDRETLLHHLTRLIAFRYRSHGDSSLLQRNEN